MQCLNIRMMRHIQKTTQSVWTDVTTTLVWKPLIRFLFISKHQAGKLLQEHYWPKLSSIAAGWKSKTDQNWAELDIQSRQPSIREEA